MKKIAFIGGRGFFSNYGGVENAIREISTRISNVEGHCVDIYGHSADNQEDTISKKDRVYILNPPKLISKCGHLISILFNTLYAISVRRPDVIILFASGPSAMCLITRLFGVPTIAGLRAIDSERDKWGVVQRKILKFGEWAALNVANRCTVNSLEMKRYYDSGRRENGLTIFIPNGCSKPVHGEDDFIVKLGLQADRYLLFVARLDPVKRAHLLIEAHRRLPPELRLPLVIAGGNVHDVEYQRHLEALADDNVLFVGHLGRQKIDPLVRQCRLFVLPSVLEGMSNSLLTAMISGKCVICSDVDANRDVVAPIDKVTFKADDIDSLYGKLEQLLLDGQLRNQLGLQLKLVAEKNNCWDRTTKSYLSLIDGLM